MPLSCVLEHGRIFVRDADPAYYEPKYFVRYWPTRFGRMELDRGYCGLPPVKPEEIQVRKCGYGYELKFPQFGFWADVPVRGDQLPHHFEEEPIPCPKVRAGIQTRWRDGMWRKLLKSGWTII